MGTVKKIKKYFFFLTLIMKCMEDVTVVFLIFIVSRII